MFDTHTNQYGKHEHTDINCALISCEGYNISEVDGNGDCCGGDNIYNYYLNDGSGYGKGNLYNYANDNRE